MLSAGVSRFPVILVCAPEVPAEAGTTHPTGGDCWDGSTVTGKIASLMPRSLSGMCYIVKARVERATTGSMISCSVVNGETLYG